MVLLNVTMFYGLGSLLIYLCSIDYICKYNIHTLASTHSNIIHTYVCIYIYIQFVCIPIIHQKVTYHNHIYLKISVGELIFPFVVQQNTIKEVEMQLQEVSGLKSKGKRSQQICFKALPKLRPQTF